MGKGENAANCIFYFSYDFPTFFFPLATKFSIFEGENIRNDLFLTILGKPGQKKTRGP